MYFSFRALIIFGMWGLWADGGRGDNCMRKGGGGKSVTCMLGILWRPERNIQQCLYQQSSMVHAPALNLRHDSRRIELLKYASRKSLKCNKQCCSIVSSPQSHELFEEFSTKLILKLSCDFLGSCREKLMIHREAGCIKHIQHCRHILI